jgi:poly-gamma-glutamate capsule biosynthesis protein CapA/YwtB (metallophosphatase superfamily)
MSKKRMLFGFLILIAFVVASAGLLIYQYNLYTKKSMDNPEKVLTQVNNQKQVRDQEHTTLPEPVKLTEPIKPAIHQTIQIAAIGDILLHKPLYEDAYHDGKYSFNNMFQAIAPLTKEPDFLLANMESTPGGASLGFSTYPKFNSPSEIVDALKNNGVDMLTTANNHSLDKGERGILNAIQYYKKLNMPYVGSFESQADHDRIRVQDVNGVKLAILSYTYGTNGEKVPNGKDYLVNYIDEGTISSLIREAHKVADLVIVCLHWGEEYQPEPNLFQKKLAEQLSEEGADIIFGSHPHVLQPAEKIIRTNGKETMVFYSLGNFLSGQTLPNTDIGGIATVSVTLNDQNGNRSITFNQIDFLPTYVYQEKYHHYSVWPLSIANEKKWTQKTESQIKNFVLNQP